MSSNHRREERRKEIMILKQQGLDAAAAGKSIHSCPREYMNNMNRRHWEEGFLSFQPEKPEPYQIPELIVSDFPDVGFIREDCNMVLVPFASSKNLKVLVDKINHMIQLINVREYDRQN
jgi:ribosome modulation factor